MRPEAVVPGIERFPTLTPTLPPATTTNSYALGEREVLLVEPATPYDDEQQAWLAWARAIAAAGRRLVAIFATHEHPDHIGGAERFARELGLPLWAHALTGARAGLTLGRALDEGDELALDGASPQRWRCLHTPGHALGHLCLHETTLGVTVVGDMVASEGTILIDPSDGDLGRYLAELERLATLDARLALPAHGAPIVDPARLYRHYIAHRRMREGKVLAALTTEPRTIAELLPFAYDDTPELLWPLAARSLESHLLELGRQGRARRESAGWRAG